MYFPINSIGLFLDSFYMIYYKKNIYTISNQFPCIISWQLQHDLIIYLPGTDSVSSTVCIMDINGWYWEGVKEYFVITISIPGYLTSQHSGVYKNPL